MDINREVYENYPEDTKRSRNRFEGMKIKMSPYGVPKFFMPESFSACEKCVFDSGEHTCGQSKT